MKFRQEYEDGDDRKGVIQSLSEGACEGLPTMVRQAHHDIQHNSVMVSDSEISSADAKSTY